MRTLLYVATVLFIMLMACIQILYLGINVVRGTGMPLIAWAWSIGNLVMYASTARYFFNRR